MTTRADIDAIVAGHLAVTSAGPVSKSKLNALIDDILDYVDGEGTTDISALGSEASVTGTLALDANVFMGGRLFELIFTLTTVRIAVTDAAGSGSYGSTKLFDFTDEMGVTFLGCRQNYTAYVADGTGVPDDAAFEIGVGTTAISSAADGTLGNGAQENIGAAVSQTLSGGTTTGTGFTGGTAAVDGTGTAVDINLNWSGSAATIDDDGTIDVTGTIQIIGMTLGDD